MRVAAVLGMLTLVSACASNSGALKIGPDTYQVTAQRHNFAAGLSGAQASALGAAEKQCRSMGRELMVVDTSSGFQRPYYTFRATFRCLAANDPALRRPTLEAVPDVVIEDRRR